jgi:hypothetical protein
MSEHISWATCPHCGQQAAVGWISTVAADGEPTGEIAVEFDCVADCQLSASQVALAFGASCDPAGTVVHSDVVMHDIVPVSHELFINVILVEQRNRLDAGQEVVPDRGNEVIRLRFGGNVGQSFAVRVKPGSYEVAGCLCEISKIRRI